MKRLVNTVLILVLLCLTCMGTAFAKQRVVPVYRVYNPETGEHLYTTNTLEVTTLVDDGWEDEKTAWVAPNRGDPVYRLYNPGYHLHLYTKDENEIKILTTKERGWQYDNNGGPLFFSDGEIPIYRLYSPVINEHHLTTDENEYEVLGESEDWNQENIAFYAIEAGSDKSGYGIDPYADVPKHETVKMVVLNGIIPEEDQYLFDNNQEETAPDETEDNTVTDPEGDKTTPDTEGDQTNPNLDQNEDPSDTNKDENTSNHKGVTVPNFDVYFTPANSGTEQYLGNIINTELVGTDYSGIQIGSFEPGTYRICYEIPNTNLMYTGTVNVTHEDIRNYELVDRPTGQLQLIYKEIQLTKVPNTNNNKGQ